MAASVGVIGALEKEIRNIYDALDDASFIQEAGLTIARGTFEGMEVVATCAGMGTVNAAAATQHLISRYGVQAIIFSGIAGGLNPALHISDIVIGERLRYLDTDSALIAESAPSLEEFSSTPALVELAERILNKRGYVDANAATGSAAAAGLQYLRGTIASGDRFITGSDVKARVIAETQADCVEMEGAAIAHIAAKNAVDVLILRAISDNCDESYDALSDREFDLAEYAANASAIVLELLSELAGKR